MKKTMVLLAALAALGCGDDSGESLVRSALDAEDEGTRFYCECFFAADEYASEAACLTDNLLTNPEKSCLAEAYGPVVEYNPSYVRCITGVSRDLNQCISRFGCGVTEAQIDACLAEVEGRCGPEDDDSLCVGLVGASLTECQAEEARANAAAEACFPG